MVNYVFVFFGRIKICLYFNCILFYKGNDLKKKMFLMNSVYIDVLLFGNGSCKESSLWKIVKLIRNICI